MKLTRIVASGLAVALATVLCAGPVVAAGAKAAPSGKINLNTASAEQLVGNLYSQYTPFGFNGAFWYGRIRYDF